MVGINAATLLQRALAPALVLVFLTGATHAQSNRNFPPGLIPYPQAPGPPGFPQFQNPNQPPPQARNQVCMRLEAQLAAIGSGSDPARADQIKRYEDAADRQQAELDRVIAQSRRLSCEGGGLLSIFTQQNPQCAPLTNQIQQMRGNLDRMLMDLERLQGAGNSANAAQRQQVISALAQNGCGAQYREAVTRSGGGIFDALLGPGTITSNNAMPDTMQSNTFRTICVRSCDGYFFPISFATVPGRFQDDERICQRMCPAAEVSLYAHRNPGEDVSQAVSITGAPYTALPNAFRYRQQFDKSCSCRAPGQSWADALKQYGNDRVEAGDVVVTEDQAKRMSQPTPAKAQQKSDPRAKGNPAAKSAAPAPATPPAAAAASTDAPRQIRSVGPTFVAPAKSTPAPATPPARQ